MLVHQSVPRPDFTVLGTGHGVNIHLVDQANAELGLPFESR